MSYTAKVKLYLGALGGELVAELPFILMNPKDSLKPPFLREDSKVMVRVQFSGPSHFSRQNNQGDNNCRISLSMVLCFYQFIVSELLKMRKLQVSTELIRQDSRDNMLDDDDTEALHKSYEKFSLRS